MEKMHLRIYLVWYMYKDDYSQIWTCFPENKSEKNTAQFETVSELMTIVKHWVVFSRLASDPGVL